MKKTFVLFLLLFFVLSVSSVSAVDRHFGLGAVLGEPSGITGKVFMTDNSAVDATLSWSFVKENLYVHSDYLQHFSGIFGSDVPTLLAYVGIGGMIELKEDPKLGLRIPFGLSYTIPDTPVELFIELAPGMLLVPETDGDFTGGIGARYYF